MHGLREESPLGGADASQIVEVGEELMETDTAALVVQLVVRCAAHDPR